jgi:hypothetical protein
MPHSVGHLKTRFGEGRMALKTTRLTSRIKEAVAGVGSETGALVCGAVLGCVRRFQLHAGTCRGFTEVAHAEPMPSSLQKVGPLCSSCQRSCMHQRQGMLAGRELGG